MKTKRYHVVSVTDGCWQYLGHSKNYSKALGIAYEFIHSIMDSDDVFTVKKTEDTANYFLEELTITVPENESHSELTYPIVIFYEFEDDTK